MTHTPGPSDDPTGGWKVGDPVLFRPRMGFDATFKHGTIVDIRIDDSVQPPAVKFRVQIDPPGGGRLLLDLQHLNHPAPPDQP